MNRRTSLVVCAMYLATLVAPPLHEVLEHTVDHEHAHEHVAEGPQLRAQCDPTRPCDDPDHHHDDHGPARHADDCLVCNVGLNHCTFVLTPGLLSYVPQASRRLSVDPGGAVLPERSSDAFQARAPPPLS